MALESRMRRRRPEPEPEPEPSPPSIEDLYAEAAHHAAAVRDGSGPRVVALVIEAPAGFGWPVPGSEVKQRAFRVCWRGSIDAPTDPAEKESAIRAALARMREHPPD